MRGMLKDVLPGATVWGTWPVGPEAERTPPVRRPARREARGFGAWAVAIAWTEHVKVGDAEVKSDLKYGRSGGAIKGRRIQLMWTLAERGPNNQTWDVDTSNSLSGATRWVGGWWIGK